MRKIGQRNREGVVLLLALLCLVVIEITAIGLHYLALQEWRTSQAVARDAELRLEARSAVSRAISAFAANRVDTLPLHGTTSLPSSGAPGPSGISASAEIERVGLATFLVRGTARSPLLEVARAGLLVETVTADQLSQEVSDALRSGGVVSVGAGALVDAPRDSCSGQNVINAIRFGRDGNLVIDGGAVAGSVAMDSTSRLDRAGPLSIRRLQEIAALTPIVSYYSGALTLNELQGPAVLVVDGDLVLAGGRFEGVILVSGTVTVAGGAHVFGTLIAEGGVVLDHATVTYSACSVRASLDQPALLGPFLPRGRRWIPVF